ncbi:hypothetical protein GmRootV35_60040 [Variovorax sp. V35]
MRIASVVFRSQTHALKKFSYARAYVAAVQAICDARANAPSRVQGPEWILKNNLHLLSQLAHVSGACAAQIASVKAHVARGRRIELKDASGKRGLSTPRLADDTERFPARKCEGNVFDRVEPSRRASESICFDGKALRETLDLKDFALC